ncbi:MAG TPA: M1 family aminopeptidase [Casimicrobiaceae bacterium]|nr:M1 family aminopeptidase [Casimicrobiaceae bacterium]
MGTLLAIARFEVRTRVKRLSTWVYFVAFFAIAMLWTAAAGGAIANANIIFGSGKIWINSPYAIAQTVAFLGMFGLTVIAALAGRAVQQDFEHRTESFFFTAPISKGQYLGGRYAGALAVLLIVFVSIALGIFAGTLLPNLDAERLGPSRLAAYVIPYFTVVLPNLVWIGGVFFCIAALTRRMLPVYIGSVLCLVGYLVAQGLLRDMENKTLASLIDPFGVVAASRVTEYWTIAERNTRLLPFEGLLLWNRLLWIAVGATLVGLCYARFRFAHPQDRQARRKEEPDVVEPPPGVFAALRTTPARVGGLALLPSLAWMYFRETVRNVYFGVFAFAGILFLIASSTTVGSLFGTTTWPVTYQMLELVSGTFGVFMLVIITYYAGELVWRERDQRFDQIADALPTPTWLPLVAKLVALMAIPVILQAVLMVTGMAIQAAKGYHHFEPGLYLYDLFTIDIAGYWLVCVLAITVQSVVNHKYVGHFAMVAYYLMLAFSGVLGFEHNLYKYAASIPYTYSDMNGYGHFLPRLRAFQAYNAAIALLLLVGAYLLWTRGTVPGWRARLVRARARLTRPVIATAGGAALATVALGSFIFYNTNILNHYVTTHDMLARQADYEKLYKPLAAAPQPTITAVDVAVDLYPQEQRVRMRGHYDLVNRNAVPVEDAHLFFANGERIEATKLAFDPPAQPTKEDLRIGLRSYHFAQPLAPGATGRLDFDLTLATHGFENAGSMTDVVYNGSFVNARVMLPIIGYSDRGELATDRDRRKFGLAPKERMRDRDDPAGLAHNVLGHDADWITFRAEITTDPDQIAIAPGYLQRDWVEGGRRHFMYAMDTPILDFFAFQSARYAVRRDKWNDVNIEVYYQPGHEYNLDRMIAATKASLDYYSRNFGPYQHHQFRILEFPRYASFAQAFPNTIPYSESIGFIARVRENDKDDIDYPYYVTAHEAAHQWWAHQVIGGDVQGATALSETLAQYSALMVMKEKYGEAKMQKFLAYELDRYLIGRASEQKKELPLGRVENQDYIHYRKGSLVMYALQDYIGEDKVNAALHALRDKWAYKGPPYPSATALIAELRAVTPPQYQYVIDDWFESITLFDNRATKATAKALGDGRYEVSVDVVARKLKADELGKETDAPLHDFIDIGVLDADGVPLYREKKAITAEKTSFTVTVDKKPAKAGIDPLNLLIDRRPKDNTVNVEIAR